MAGAPPPHRAPPPLGGAPAAAPPASHQPTVAAAAAAAAAAAWTHLQVPNYFPRQPQVAHMSSDRPLSHSPLTWHTPTPPEHQQNVKGTSNLFRHTPTPPDVPILKGTSSPMFRHTPTPPDRDGLKMYRHTPTPPDGQSIKNAPNTLYRHTPTPPDIVHGMKGVPLYRHTPPPDGLKSMPNPLFNLQQMISDRSIQRTPESLRENLVVRSDNMGFSRHSPGLTLGSVDLSVTKSPRSNNQNGEIGTPMSLSIRDTTKINNLDSAEINKIHQVSSSYVSKPIDVSISSCSTSNIINQSSNSPKSPKSSGKRPVKKVDSILERLNSGSDGVVITPIHTMQSPHSVIVNPQSADDNNGRNLCLALNQPLNVSSCDEGTVDVNIIKTSQFHNVNENLPISTSILTICTDTTSNLKTNIGSASTKDLPTVESLSVIKESSVINKNEPSPNLNFSNEDSNGSSSDSNKSRRRRKQLKTTKVENSDINNEVSDEISVLNPTGNDIVKSLCTENKNSMEACDKTLKPDISISNTQTDLENNYNANVSNSTILDRKQDCNIDVTSFVCNTRKRSSESETIDDIAAMIASTDTNTIKDTDLPVSDTTGVNKSIDFKQKCEEMSEPELSNVLSDAYVKNDIGDNMVEMASSLAIKNSTVNISKLDMSSTIKSQELVSIADVCDNNTNEVQDKNKPISETTSFVEVENELEKMFAGIEEIDSSTNKDTDNFSNAITETLNATSNTEIPSPSKIGKKRSYRKSSVSSGLLSSDENTPKKKQKAKKRSLYNKSDVDLQTESKLKTSNGKKNKMQHAVCKDAYDSGSNASSSKSRGPYIQIKGPRDSPLSVNIINTPIQEDDIDKPFQKIKTLKSKTVLCSDSNFKNKVKSKGLHTSTLSMKYDATTTDTSWICVFCKKGPHTRPTHQENNSSNKVQRMGDLFGPYIVSTDCNDYVSMISDPKDTFIKGKCRQGPILQSKQLSRNKKMKLECDLGEVKNKFPNDEMYMGMTEAGNNSYEIWLHEDCAVWAPGLYLVGAKIIGLDTAVWSCCTIRCDSCSYLGATVACIKRGCQKTMHVNCARFASWSLSEDNFLVYCNEHKLP